MDRKVLFDLLVLSGSFLFLPLSNSLKIKKGRNPEKGPGLKSFWSNSIQSSRRGPAAKKEVKKERYITKYIMELHGFHLLIKSDFGRYFTDISLRIASREILPSSAIISNFSGEEFLKFCNISINLSRRTSIFS